MNIQSFCRATLVALGLLAFSAASHAEWSIGVSVGFPPPALPVYEQPPIPAAGYLWTPGYWAYDGEVGDYYWVPGTWVLAPRPGYLWTPGYWAADGAYFAWHAGYWGPEVGFYGGINYGFGYFGIGFGGGYWRGHDFCYNRAVTNINNVSITNVYNNTTIVNNQVTNSRVSYNGGRDGIRLRPSGAQQALAHAPHLAPTNEQVRHESAARSIPALRAAANHGQPSIAATVKPAVFAGSGPTAARGAGDISSLHGGSHAAPARADAVAGRAPAGTQPYRASNPAPIPAAGSGARSAALPARQAGNVPRNDRPAWADRGGVQYLVHSATTPAAATRDARNYSSAAARAPTQRSTPATHAASDYRYAPHQPPRPAYAQRTATPPRESGRAPSYSAPHPAGNAAPARSGSAPHGNGDAARHGPLHS